MAAVFAMGFREGLAGSDRQNSRRDSFHFWHAGGNLRIVRITLLAILSFLTLALVPYLVSPIYDFPDKRPFSGEKFYNPYQGIASGRWLRANFHSHSFCWLGLTDGRRNDPTEMLQRYTDMNYDICAISDYMRINSETRAGKIYIPVYEHGYGITKNHQLVIGAGSVNWLDYLFLQNAHNKQNVLKNIKKADNLVVLAHPRLRNAYTAEDMCKLTDFDFIEIANQNYGNALDIWDAALSNGTAVFCLSNDDSHNSVDFLDIGKCFTLVNSVKYEPDAIMSALKEGKTIAVILSGEGDRESLIEKHQNLPELSSLEVEGNTVKLVLTTPVKEIIFTGFGGKQVQVSSDCNWASYEMKPEDSYIRLTLVNEGNDELYLNPVFRYSGNSYQVYYSSINEYKTLVLRLGFVICLGASVILGFRLRRKRHEVLES